MHSLKLSDPRDPSGLNLIATAIEEIKQRLREQHADPIQLSYTLSKLAAEAYKDGDPCFSDKLLAIAYIAYLEAIGVIKPDNYNGVCYANMFEPPTKH